MNNKNDDVPDWVVGAGKGTFAILFVLFFAIVVGLLALAAGWIWTGVASVWS